MLLPYLNASYSVFSYGIKRYGNISVSPPVPLRVSVELSSRCNLSCPECVTGAGLLRRKNGFIDYSVAEKMAGELRGRVLSVWLYGQGEPMLHPRFFDIISLFRRMNAVISTNGHFLDEENCIRLVNSGLKKIIISYDGITPASYNMYRVGGDHLRVTNGIRRLAEINKQSGSPLKTELQFLLHRHNEHEVREAARFARSVGADFMIKSMQVLDSERAGDWMPADSNKSRYRFTEGNWELASAPSAGCIRMWTALVVTSDGDVVPCCFDKQARHVMGNINESTLSAIWTSERYASFRSDVMKSRSLADICAGCPQGNRLFFRR